MNLIKCIAVLQTVGGLYGLITFTKHIAFLKGIEETNGLIDSLFFILLLISVVSGVLLFLNKKWGFLLSIILQLLQTVRFTFGSLNFGFHILFSIGIYISIMKQKFGIGIDLEFPDTYLFLYMKVIYKYNLYLPFHVTVNLTALLFFAYLCLMYDQIFPRKYTHPGQEEAVAAAVSKSN